MKNLTRCVVNFSLLFYSFIAVAQPQAEITNIPAVCVSHMAALELLKKEEMKMEYFGVNEHGSFILFTNNKNTWYFVFAPEADTQKVCLIASGEKLLKDSPSSNI